MVRYGSLPFAEAIEYLKTKVPQATDHWDDIEGQAHDHAFIVAGAAKADLLTDLHQAVRKAQEQGTTLEDFRRDFDAITANHGWTGFTGDGSAEGRAWRTKVIYGTNLRTSHQAGRLSQMRAIQSERPYWRYRHNDTVQHPRPEHQAWNGKVLRADDPWWGTHYPPNGWGCRCYIETLAPRDLKREGITVDEAPDDGTYEHVDRHGEPHTLPKGIDYGWDHQPGSTRDLVAEVQGRAGKMPAGIGRDLVQELGQVEHQTARRHALHSEELAIKAGDLRPPVLGEAHQRARDAVVGLGRDTTKEHGAAVFADGHSESFGGAFENRLQVPRFSAPDGSVTIHHNHPNGDSLSRADLFIMLERPELGRVDAHGHQGFWASAERPGTAMAPEEALAIVEDAAARARTMLTKAVQRGHIRAEAAQSGLWQVVMSRLLEQQGIIRYTVNSEAVLAMANQVLQ